MDSETKISNIRILSNSVFPDTTKLYFDGEEATLKELLDQRIPIGLDSKISPEYLPETLLYDRGFSGAKIAAISNTTLVQKDVEQYLSFDQRVYDHDGGYVGSQVTPPGGYQFCITDAGLYGVNLEFKFKNSPVATANKLSVEAKIKKVNGETFSLGVIKRDDLTSNEMVYISTGVIETMLEDGDCIFFTIKQSAIGGVVQGGLSTNASIHKVVKVPESSDNWSIINANGNVVLDCGSVRDCIECPDGIEHIENDIIVSAPVGYVSEPNHSITLSVSNCNASLVGYIELPEPLAGNGECDPNAMIECISQANASPEDLGIVFSQEQVMAIVGGFATMTKFNCLENRVEQLEDYFEQIFGDPDTCQGTELYEPLCNLIDNCGD